MRVVMCGYWQPHRAARRKRTCEENAARCRAANSWHCIRLFCTRRSFCVSVGNPVAGETSSPAAASATISCDGGALACICALGPGGPAAAPEPTRNEESCASAVPSQGTWASSDLDSSPFSIRAARAAALASSGAEVAGASIHDRAMSDTVGRVTEGAGRPTATAAADEGLTDAALGAPAAVALELWGVGAAVARKDGAPVVCEGTACRPVAPPATGAADVGRTRADAATVDPGAALFAGAVTGRSAAALPEVRASPVDGPWAEGGCCCGAPGAGRLSDARFAAAGNAACMNRDWTSRGLRGGRQSEYRLRCWVPRHTCWVARCRGARGRAPGPGGCSWRSFVCQRQQDLGRLGGEVLRRLHSSRS